MNLHEIYPLLVLGGIIGMFSIIFVVAYATMKNKKEVIGFDRHMKDSEIIVRLLRYAHLNHMRIQTTKKALPKNQTKPGM